MAGNPLTNLFGKSPIAPIQQHMTSTRDCAQLLTQFMDAAVAGDWDQAKTHQKAIAKLENEADKLKKQVRLQLPKSLFLPVPRSDLLDLVGVQDHIANLAKDIAGLMLGRQMEIPAKLVELMGEYLKLAIDTVNQAHRAIDELDELLESGFRGREVDFVESLINELDKLEHENDKAQVKIRAVLFKLEAELPPVNVMFLYKIIDWVGELANEAQKVGSRLQILLAR
ncbi:TIGR00153 family protein [Litorivivens sp.]|uniref:TIGR00153 family protein n=1 Tax=Litorivivens sp. TaxID=2020868 RepID=UPI00356AB6EE